MSNLLIPLSFTITKPMLVFTLKNITSGNPSVFDILTMSWVQCYDLSIGFVGNGVMSTGVLLA